MKRRQVRARLTEHARFALGSAFKLLLFGSGLFLLLEASARVHLFGVAALVPNRIDSVRLFFDGEWIQRSRHPAVGFELKPNLDTYYKLVPLRTNSQGLRDAEYTLEKPENTFRVAVLGSSFTFPVGVEIGSAYHTLLEDRLHERYGSPRYEFINFSCVAYHPSQLIATLELKALDYRPDLILFATTGLAAPLLLESAQRPNRGFVRAPRTYPFFRSFFLAIIDRRTGRGPRPGYRWDERTGFVEKLLIATAAREAGPEEWPETVAPRTPQSSGQGVTAPGKPENVLQRLAAIQTATGIPIVVVRLEARGAEKRSIDLWIEGRARALGIPYLDTRGGFEGAPASDFWIYELDPHPNAAAHEIFAELIADFLQEHRLLGS